MWPFSRRHREPPAPPHPYRSDGSRRAPDLMPEDVPPPVRRTADGRKMREPPRGVLTGMEGGGAAGEAPHANP